MAKRYTDNRKENKIDFVPRDHGISVLQILSLLFGAIVLIIFSYQFNEHYPLINIAINIIVLTGIAIFLFVKIRNYLNIIGNVEYQSMIFSNALNHNTEFCLILNHEGEIIYADSRFRERFKDSDVAMNLDNVLKYGNVTEQEIQEFNKAIKSKTSIQTYFLMNRKNGVSNFALILDPISANPEVAIDTTQKFDLLLTPLARPQNYFVLKALKISKEQVYEQLISNHSVGSYVINQNGAILSANNSFLEMIELKKLEKGMSILDFLAQDNGQALNKGEALLCTLTGIPFRVRMSQAVFYDKYNHSYVYGLVTPTDSIIRDYHLHPCFVDAPFAIAQCDTSGKFIKQNKVLIQHAKQNNQSIYTFTHPDYHKKIKEYFLSNSLNSMSLDIKLTDQSEVKAYFSKFKHNNKVFIMFYLIDAAERRDLEMQLEHSQKMQAIGQLAGGIAHDFNNILTAIIGFCDLLLIRHSINDPSFPDIMQIKKNANRAANLIKQLLAFSRKQTLQPRVIALNNVIADLSYMIKRLIGENIEFKVHYERSLGMTKADRGQLEQVIINLLVNARAAMEMGGKVVIRTSNIAVDSLSKIKNNMFSPDKEKMENGEYILLEVIDYGCGMRKEVMEKIFDPFFSTKDIGLGTGLGLSTVYGIVKQTGGYIYVTSKLNVGTKFQIFLPRVYDYDDLMPAESLELLEPHLTNENASEVILLIEDEDPVRMFSKKALERKGYKVLDTNSGKVALEIVKTQIVDMIISDVVMPNMSGPEIISEVVKIQPEAKIIFISGYAEEVFEKHTNLYSSKINFLAKPFTLNQLTQKVKDVLNS